MDAGRAAERRLVTCLFLDIVGSTELLMSIAPERMKRVLDDAFSAVRSIVGEHGGTVEKYIGDAVFALFGAPVAHGDDPLRALRAAQACRDWAAASQRVAVRIGVETGEALVDVTAAEHERQRMAIGMSVNVAARLQAAAEPGAVLIGPTCQEAVADEAELEPFGALDLKGIGSIPVWQLVRVREGGAARLPFVGREPEFALLRDAFARAVAGAGTFVLVSAPPGQGKSRLVSEFIAATGTRGIVARCRPGAESGAMTPLRQLLAHDAEPTREAVERRVAELFADPAEQRRIAGALVHSAGIATTDVLPAHPMERQDELVSAWRRYLAAVGAGAATVVCIEDLHWAEPQLVRLLDRLTFAAEAPLLVIATARPEFGGASALRAGADRVFIELPPLGSEAALSLARSAGRVDERVIERAEGNPLFIVELARSQRGGRDLPVNLQGAIAARLDELPARERELLQRAAVVGETFSVRDVALLAERDARDVAGALARLEHGAYVDRANGHHRFHHALVRDVAYGRLTVAERMRLHAHYAREGVHPDDVEALAHHWWEALRPPDADWVWEADRTLPRMRHEALQALIAAGRRHADRFAHEQAVEAYGRALQLTDDPREVASIERAIGAAYARNAQGDDAWEHRLRAIDAYRRSGDAAPAALYAEMLAVPTYNWGFFKRPPDEVLVETLLREGEQIARESGDVPSLTRLLVHRAYYEGGRSELADEALTLVDASADPIAHADVLQRLAMVQCVTGEITRADETYERVAQLMRVGASVDELEYLIFRSTVKLLLGEIAAADELADRALELSRPAGAHLRTHALQAKVLVAAYRGDWAAVETLARDTVNVVDRNPATPWCLRGGWAVAAGAIASVLAGGRDDVGRYIAIAEPMAAAGPARVNTLLLPRAMSGEGVALPAPPPIVRPWHRQIVDPLGVHEAISLWIGRSGEDLEQRVARLAAAGAAGARVAGAVAEAIGEELAGPHAAPRRQHEQLHALGCFGLSQLISFRPA